MDLEIRKFEKKAAGDFVDLHSTPPGDCFCAFWYLEAGEDWKMMTAEQNRQRREGLLERGEYDGYLAYADGKVAGWCQVGPRDRLGQLVRKFGLAPDPETFAISCFFIAPAHRRKGIATRLLSQVLRDLRAKGVRRVEAYPRRGEALTVDDMWNGPEPMLARAGFVVVREDASRPLMAMEL